MLSTRIELKNKNWIQNTPKKVKWKIEYQVATQFSLLKNFKTARKNVRGRIVEKIEASNLAILRSVCIVERRTRVVSTASEARSGSCVCMQITETQSNFPEMLSALRADESLRSTSAIRSSTLIFSSFGIPYECTHIKKPLAFQLKVAIAFLNVSAHRIIRIRRVWSARVTRAAHL